MTRARKSDGLSSARSIKRAHRSFANRFSEEKAGINIDNAIMSVTDIPTESADGFPVRFSRREHDISIFRFSSLTAHERRRISADGRASQENRPAVTRGDGRRREFTSRTDDKLESHLSPATINFEKSGFRLALRNSSELSSRAERTFPASSIFRAK